MTPPVHQFVKFRFRAYRGRAGGALLAPKPALAEVQCLGSCARRKHGSSLLPGWASHSNFGALGQDRRGAPRMKTTAPTSCHIWSSPSRPTERLTIRVCTRYGLAKHTHHDAGVRAIWSSVRPVVATA